MKSDTFECRSFSCNIIAHESSVLISLVIPVREVMTTESQLLSSLRSSTLVELKLTYLYVIFYGSLVVSKVAPISGG